MVLLYVDKVEAARRNEVIAVIKALNPTAEIVQADHGRVALNKILGTGTFDLELDSARPAWKRGLAGVRHSINGA